MLRCPWATKSQVEQDYHDQQWGKPTKEDEVLFEFLILEMMQAGLSWRTVLEKREAMRQHFSNFKVEDIAHYDLSTIDQLMQEPSIIRNRRKLEAMVQNAKMFIKVQQEFKTFSQYLWSFTHHAIIDDHPSDPSLIPTQSPLSKQISDDLKARGFKFVGPVIIYSYLEAMGIINNHLEYCVCRNLQK